MSNNHNNSSWALILGASSGFGEAVALKLAEDGYNIAGVHLDRQATIHNVERIKEQIKNCGVESLFFNINAADEEKRKDVLNEMEKKFHGKPSVKVLVHSLAFGTLKAYISNKREDVLTKAQMEMTVDVMAHSLVYWVQDLYLRNMLERKARIFAMTSSGGHTAIPFYGAVSAAKAALESHVRQLACELGPIEASVNAIMAGVTDTPALRKIPGNRMMIEVAGRRNPQGRLTTPEDVGKIVSLLCKDGGHWISGGVINADGGEDVVNFVGQGKPLEY
ncbi:MAG: SDR family oxidoreductase [Ignavibacteriaceae bacterium]|nr:SDR family oxidoreductase [Ignavibacteriaceae bacterium]